MAYGIKLKRESDGALEGVIRQNPFPALSDGSTVAWDCGNDRFPQAKLTSTQSFTINMTNVLSGAQGVLKLITNTASAITLTFDTDFTNKAVNETLTTYTFPASTGKEYFLSFVVDGTSIEWIIAVVQTSSLNPWVRLSRQATQTIATATLTVVSWDTETTDLSAMYDSGNPTRITIPGSGNKIFRISVVVNFAVGSTGIRRVRVIKNGAFTSFTPAIVTTGGVAVVGTDVLVSAALECVGGDYFEVDCQHTQGSNLNITASLSASVEERS